MLRRMVYEAFRLTAALLKAAVITLLCDAAAITSPLRQRAFEAKLIVVPRVMFHCFVGRPTYERNDISAEIPSQRRRSIRGGTRHRIAIKTRRV